MEEAVHYVTNIADSDLIVETFHRVRFPQRMPVVQGGELLPINIARSSCWHDRKKLCPGDRLSLRIAGAARTYCDWKCFTW